MANIKVEIGDAPFNGQEIAFRAPCDCASVTGIKLVYPEGSKVLKFSDAHCNDLTGTKNLFAANSIVKCIVDIDRGNAVVVNADTNAYIEGAISDLKKNSVGTYVHSKSGTVHTLTGAGNTIRFYATATWNPGDSLQINGKDVSCYNNLYKRVESEELFAKYAYVSCTINDAGTACFFKLGGGLSESNLATTTAAPGDVLSGKTFYSGDKTLKTGTLIKGTTGTFTSKYNEAVSVNVGFKPTVIMLSYAYSANTATVIVFNASTPGSYYCRTGVNFAALYDAYDNNITNGIPSIYGYIELTNNGFKFTGYYSASGNQAIMYCCY